MKFSETIIKGAFLVDIERREDERGFFARVWCAEELAAAGIDPSVAQVNMSFNGKTGTLRGLHFQHGEHAEGKFIRCIRGSLYDVIVDIREESPTYGKWFGVELNSSNKMALYAPPGCAHGFQTLEDGTEILYMSSSPYHGAAEGGIRWDDPAFGIKWPAAEARIISAKDLEWPDFQLRKTDLHPAS